jgi:hypothetical protein
MTWQLLVAVLSTRLIDRFGLRFQMIPESCIIRGKLRLSSSSTRRSTPTCMSQDSRSLRCSLVSCFVSFTQT